MQREYYCCGLAAVSAAMPPKYEAAGNGTTAQVTSDLVVVGHDESNNENAGGEARRKGEGRVSANGSNGHTADENVEWHRGLVALYKQLRRAPWTEWRLCIHQLLRRART